MNLNLLNKQFSNKVQFLKKNCISNKVKMLPIHKKPFTVLVEGNIGSGKTTFLQWFEKNEKILCLPEPVTSWKNLDGKDLLSLFYSDVKEFGFLFQTYVQLTMMKNHTQKTDKNIKLMERSLYSGRYVFIENMRTSNVLTSTEVAVMDEWFKWLIKNENFSADLIVYLKADPEVVYQRLKSRQRVEEKFISLEYIKKLHQYHEDWLIKKRIFVCPAPVITIDANKNLEDINTEYKQFQTQLELLSSFKLF